MLESTFEIVPLGEWLVDLAPGPPEKRRPATEVREVALYLMLAVLKGSEYFADHCWLVPPEKKSEALDHALPEIVALIDRYSQGESLVLELEIEDVLLRWDIAFPGSS